MRRLAPFLVFLIAAACVLGSAAESPAQGAGGALPLPGIDFPPGLRSLEDIRARSGNGLFLFAGDSSRNLAQLKSLGTSGRAVSFAAGEDGPPLTIVSFFATCCCSLCGQELAELKGLRGRFPSIRVILISLDAEVDGGVRAFVAESGLEAPIVHDDVGTIYRAFGTEQVPQTFVLDRQGRIVFEARRYGEGVAVPSWTSPQLVALLKAAVRGVSPNLPQPVRD